MLGAKDAALIIGVSTAHVGKLVWEGVLPKPKKHARFALEVEDVEAYALQRLAHPGRPLSAQARREPVRHRAHERHRLPQGPGPERHGLDLGEAGQNRIVMRCTVDVTGPGAGQLRAEGPMNG